MSAAEEAPEWLLVVGCASKSRYPSSKVAQRYLASLNHHICERGQRRRPLAAYHCTACGGWHVGNADVGRTRMERERNRPRDKSVPAPEQDDE